ncbi:MAG TPA: NADH-quinone oxidoreductase subunit N [Candidatus Polarisedimenticolaceae bacterium]
MDWGAVVVEAGLTALAIAVLALDLAGGRERSKAPLYWVALIGLCLLLGFSFRLSPGAVFTDAWIQDGFALYLKRIVLATGVLTVLASSAYASARGFERRSGEYLILLLFAMVGACSLASAREYLTLFVAFELLSIPLYALAAIDKTRPESPEGALKIFLFGSVSSAFLVLGLGLIFAAAGTTFWMQAGVLQHPSLFELGLVMLLVGFGFKVAMFPFYLWAPDTYQAAPTPIVAFLSVAPKAAAVVALFRLWLEAFAGRTESWLPTLAVFAGLTMVLGNLLALPQTNLKRLLAYSGVAHVGYVLTALAAGTDFGAGMALFYFVAYLFSNAGAFLAIAAIEAAGIEPTLEGVRGLVRRSPAVAGAFLVFLLSLGGIPFVLGFWGKLYVFLAAGKAGLWWLVFLGAVLAVVALFYYLNVARWMFIEKDEQAEPFTVPAPILAAVMLCVVLVTLGGLWPAVFVEPALKAVQGF